GSSCITAGSKEQRAKGEAKFRIANIGLRISQPRPLAASRSFSGQRLIGGFLEILHDRGVHLFDLGEKTTSHQLKLRRRDRHSKLSDESLKIGYSFLRRLEFKIVLNHQAASAGVIWLGWRFR